MALSDWIVPATPEPAPPVVAICPDLVEAAFAEAERVRTVRAAWLAQWIASLSPWQRRVLAMPTAEPLREGLPGIHDVRQACADLRQSSRLCTCGSTPASVPCVSAIRRAIDREETAG